jgi:predicted RNA binding protein YcfA (HicA-like mRNA interferase family)
VASLPVCSGKDCIKALQQFGYVVVRQKGSHVRLHCNAREPVTVPLHDELGRGLLRSILATAGISVDEFVEALDRV